MNCPQCGTEYLAGAAFCDNCGFDLTSVAAAPPAAQPQAPTMPAAPPAAAPAPAATCPGCNAPIQPGAAFCDNCGAALSAAAAAPSPAAVPPVAPPVVPPPPAVAPTAAPGPTTTCPGCGTPVQPGAAFCDNCGASLSGLPSAVGPTPPGVQPTPPPAVAPAARMRLVVGSTGAQLPLAGKQEYLIGREDPISGIFPDADLTPHGGDAGGVSRQHAKILVQGGQILFEDLSSTNGSWVNKQKVQPGQPVPLSDGAEVRLGRVVLLFHTN